MNLVSIDKTALNHHFNDPNFGGTKISMNPESFLGTVETFAELLFTLGETRTTQLLGLKPGYADFCKHIFMENFAGAKAGVAKITEENSHLLKTGFEVRNEGELPVLCRWFEGVEAPTAEYLDIILYTGEQLRKEGYPCETEWSIVCINAEMEPKETPLNPMTQLRNALGSEEGGSGTSINREAYLAAVEFWSTHAVVR